MLDAPQVRTYRPLSGFDVAAIRKPPSQSNATHLGCFLYLVLLMYHSLLFARDIRSLYYRSGSCGLLMSTMWEVHFLAMCTKSHGGNEGTGAQKHKQRAHKREGTHEIMIYVMPQGRTGLQDGSVDPKTTFFCCAGNRSKSSDPNH